MRLYSTTTGDQAPGWDAFDRMVLWAVTHKPGSTPDEIAALLPAGIAFHLIHSALRTLTTDGRIVQTVATDVRYQPAHQRHRSELAQAA